MQVLLMNRLISLRRRRLVQIVQKTLVSVFPFMLLTTCILIFSEAVFEPTGFINSLFDIDSWFPYFQLTGRLLSNLVYLLGGITAPLAAYFAAKYTAGSYGRSTGTAGISAFVFSLLINSRELFAVVLNDGDLTRINLPVNFNLFVAILIGCLIGQIFRLSNPLDDQIVDDHYVYRPRTVRPIFLTILLGVVWNWLLSLGTQYNVFSSIQTFLNNLFLNGRGVFQVSINTFWRSVSAWIGNSSPYNELGFLSDSDALTNLNAALENGSTSSIPHLFTDTNLYAAYGDLAGLGGALALIVALLWKSCSQKNQSVGIRSIFPALFNHGVPAMVGIPVFFNVLYLIPFVLVPLVNVLIAAALLALRIMPPAVYPVPNGTPNILHAFVATAGSLRALAVSILLFGLDVLIYLPFVKFDNQLHERIRRQEERGEENEEKN